MAVSERPSSQTCPPALPPNIVTLPQTAQLEALYTIIRNKDTSRQGRLYLLHRPHHPTTGRRSSQDCRDPNWQVWLPVPAAPFAKSYATTGETYNGVGFEGRICGVSILRAGEAMEAGLREVCRSVRIGKILIQRLPEDIAQRYVLLLDPMLATGGSAIKAVEAFYGVLMEAGVPEERIMFLNLIASPEGIRTFCGKYPALRMITGWIDKGLNEKAYIIPGLGDFGERR
ncbi:Uracil phosphoribosyltransferase, synthesizes UMP from uracil [Ceratobasidium sp. 414]|nr:Uracil phosphoribosyltransferase, synthesizes UMP from uracil [Ceratobasidium sp. 414]